MAQLAAIHYSQEVVIGRKFGLQHGDRTSGEGRTPARPAGPRSRAC